MIELKVKVIIVVINLVNIEKVIWDLIGCQSKSISCNLIYGIHLSYYSLFGLSLIFILFLFLFFMILDFY